MSKPLPNHMARAVQSGRRPYFTCTIAPETLPRIDEVATSLNLSRGALLDRIFARMFGEDI